MSCNRKEQNLENCNCTYPSCPRKGNCCECITYHKAMNQLPACYFPDDEEKSYDRSIENFIKIYQERGTIN